MKKYIVSGISSESDGGVGRLLRMLSEGQAAYGYSLLCNASKNRIKKGLQGRNPLRFTVEVARFFWEVIRFRLRLRLLRGAKVTVIHPQTLGFKTLFRLMDSNRVQIYVVDNSFFCIRSYNYNPVKKIECLRCLGNLSEVDEVCTPYPVKFDKKKNIGFLELLLKRSGELVFLSQNELQKKLLEENYGNTTDVRVIGMDTGEWAKEYKKTEKLEHAYDLVFHGGISDAKGLDYVLRLAPFLSKYSILIPDSRSKIESYWNGGELAENLVFKACTWESGLKEEVINARMVLCPSIWSAPIEGALIKSIIFNGYVAVFSTQFGFSKELKSEQFVFVDWDLPSSAAKLIDALVRRENTEKKIIIKDIFESTELDMREF